MGLVRLGDISLPVNPGDSDEDLEWFWEELVASDGIIVSTPISCRSISPRSPSAPRRPQYVDGAGPSRTNPWINIEARRVSTAWPYLVPDLLKY